MMQADGTKNQIHIQMKKGETAMKTLIVSTVYGYQELRLVHQRYMMISMLIAIAIQMAILAGYHFNEWLNPPKSQTNNKDTEIRIDWKTFMPPPLNPNIGSGIAPSVPAKLDFGIPVPVPDCKIDEEKVFPSQYEIARTIDQQWNEIGNGNVKISDLPNPTADPEPPVDRWQPFEKGPEAVLRPVPEYPELAKRINQEGTVIVKVLINKEGKVQKAILAKTSDEMFTQAALEAAKKWVFTPALMNGQPVPVWIAIPFRFRLVN
jgi:TonB family protein